VASPPEAVIVGLLASWAEGNDAFAAQVREHFAPDATWAQPGLPTTTGPDEAIDLVQGMDAMGITSIKIDFLNIATVGDVVFTERLDDIVMADGSVAMSIKVVGVTEFRDGKISAWREYFDTGALAGLGEGAA
jgi:limonene-1,2-epoxide hydrolase